MNNTLIALVFITTSAAVSAENLKSDNYKDGFSVLGGYSVAGGDLADLPYAETGSFALGLDYTFREGFIVGTVFTPDYFSNEVGAYGVAISEEIAAVDVYGGYEFDNGLRLTGGVSMGLYDGVANVGGITGAYSETMPGFNVGVGYNYKHLVADIRFASLAGDYVLSGTNTTLMVGYQF
ncbi:hypothetical protein ACXZ7B_25915 [Vibrio owensii]